MVEWQIAGHGRWIEGSHPLKKQADKTSHEKSYKDQTYTKIAGRWKIARLKPTLLYEIRGFKVLAEREDVLNRVGDIRGIE